MADIDAVYEKVINPLLHLAETLARAEKFKKGDRDIAQANQSVVGAISKMEAIVSMAPAQEMQRPSV